MNKQAGVLVIIERQSHSLILTKRSLQLSIHAGEVSFPGGRWQRGDKDIQYTALRETHEEIGIEPQRIHIIQPMDKVFTLTGYEISPYLAEVDCVSGYQLQIEEVEQLIKLPIEKVKEKKSYQMMTRQFGGVNVKTLSFEHPEHLIWGATAKIMWQLVDLLS
ncbi:CoA pyrophosphatase [Legionella sp. W05-934-2]|jgi:8-oxo-dGTP pyrophosphatase MutT (NUDIX family)|uniref:NUDIX hydrolase n=1 Tax=Legionella sp. W05-934-2 TaxID=1198649 RepID=UPI003462AFB9